MCKPQDEFLDHRELTYAAKMRRSQGRKRRATLIMSPFIIVMMAAVIWIVNRQIHHYDIESICMIAVTLLLEAAFILLAIITWSRKLRLDKKRQTVTGRLEKITISNSNGGKSETYYIGDCQVLWPLEAGLIRDQDVGRQTSLSGVMINMESTLDLSFLPTGGIWRTLNASGSMLIVLNYKKGIDISRLLENYGMDYFERRFKNNVKKYSVLSLLAAISFISFMYIGVSMKTTMSMLIIGLGGFLASLLALVWGLVGYEEKIDQWLDKQHDYGSTTHVERLSGNVSPTSGGS